MEACARTLLSTWHPKCCADCEERANIRARYRAGAGICLVPVGIRATSQSGQAQISAPGEGQHSALALICFYF